MDLLHYWLYEKREESKMMRKQLFILILGVSEEKQKYAICHSIVSWSQVGWRKYRFFENYRRESIMMMALPANPA